MSDEQKEQKDESTPEEKTSDLKETSTEEGSKQAEPTEADKEKEERAKARAERDKARAERAKARAAAKQAEGESQPPADSDAAKEERAKARAERDKARAERAKARAAAKQAEGGEEAASADAAGGDAAKEERAKARAERAKARAAAKTEQDDEPEKPKEPSPNQPYLDEVVSTLKREVAEECVEEAFINELDEHLPVVYIQVNHWVETSDLLKKHPQMSFSYLRNISGVDHETHMEVVYHLLSMEHRKELCVKVKTERENAVIPSVTPTWSTANWNEREIFDLLGIDFPGHPDLRRIMMSDDWVGHPLRKDYEPLDPEV